MILYTYLDRNIYLPVVWEVPVKQSKYLWNKRNSRKATSSYVRFTYTWPQLLVDKCGTAHEQKP